MSSEHSDPDLVNLQSIGGIHSGNALAVVPADCADDAPC